MNHLVKKLFLLVLIRSKFSLIITSLIKIKHITHVVLLLAHSKISVQHRFLPISYGSSGHSDNINTL